AARRVDEAWIADGHVRRLAAVERGALVGEYPLELARAAIALEQGFPGLPQDRTTHDEAGCRATTLDEDVAATDVVAGQRDVGQLLAPLAMPDQHVGNGVVRDQRIPDRHRAPVVLDQASSAVALDA